MAWQRYRQRGSFVNEYNNPNNESQGDNTYKPSPYASFPHPREDDHNAPTYQQQPSAGAQPQPLGVPPRQPVKAEYNERSRIITSIN